MNNLKIYFNTSLLLNALFWAMTLQNLLTRPRGGIAGTAYIIFLFLYLAVFTFAILLSLMWGGWLLFRLGAKNRMVWLGIAFGLASLFLAWLIYFYLASSGPNPLITNPL